MKPPTFSPALRRTGAFTLIELLVVIAIIALLMGLLFPAASSVLENAKRTQAKNTATQIATAVTAYETEYGQMPPESGLISILGNITDDPVNNPRKIVFLEVPDAKGGKNGWTGSEYKDPWGENYNIEVDNDYDNKVTGPGGEVRKRVIVWSEGNSDDPKKYVKSWE